MDDRERIALFAAVEDAADDYVSSLIDYLRIPSISALGHPGVRESAEWVRARMQNLGLQAELIESDGEPFVYGRHCELPDAVTVLFYGHYDVQPTDPIDAWKTPPFEPDVRDGRVYARGSADNKGQHLAQLFGIAELLRRDALPCNVIVLLDGEEEIGSPSLEPFVRRHADLLRADVVITADGPVHESGRGVLEFGNRGILPFELRVRTADTDLHSGNWGNVAPNALWSLVRLLGTMKDAGGRITIDGFHNPVAVPTYLERVAVDALPVDPAHVQQMVGIQRFDDPQDIGFFDRLMLRPTLTICGIQGGYSGAGVKSVIPCEAVAKCDVRLVAHQTVEQVTQALAAHVQRHAPDVEFVPYPGCNPSRTPLDSPYAEPLRWALTTVHGRPPLTIPSAGGTIPDYVFTDILGLPSFGMPYGNHDEANHAPNENFELARYIAGIQTAIAVLLACGDPARELPRRAGSGAIL